MSIKSCKHCGDPCREDTVSYADDYFCCIGCKTVYGLITEHGLEDYYTYNKTPGISLASHDVKKYDYLNDEIISDKLLDYRDQETSRVRFDLPQIYCSSCLWLLERLNCICPDIVMSQVNFIKKEITVVFHHQKISLAEVARLLASLGFEPRLHLGIENKSKKDLFTQANIKLAVAGFCFANIMLLSFPEYLGFDDAYKLYFIGLFNITLSIPPFIIAYQSYFKQVILNSRHHMSNLDIPITIGLLTLFIKSIYDIVSFSGEGYLDSFAGFVFFLEIAKWYRKYKNDVLLFDTDYTSFLPISAEQVSQDQSKEIPVEMIQKGNLLRFKNETTICVDGILHSDEANIDYGFLTGESKTVKKRKGDHIYAGGKVIGESILLQAKTLYDQSKLSNIWQSATAGHNDRPSSKSLVDIISRYFTIVIITISILSVCFWYIQDSSMVVHVFTSVLIVACPCALALSEPFVYGSMLRFLTSRDIYLKDTSVLKKLHAIDSIVFDKTGTLTDSKKMEVNYIGHPLNKFHKKILYNACLHSAHPLSKAICKHLGLQEHIYFDEFSEQKGKGLEYSLYQIKGRIGSEAFTNQKSARLCTEVFYLHDGEMIGKFQFNQLWRPDIDQVFDRLSAQFQLHLISGDHSLGVGYADGLFDDFDQMLFNQSPDEKSKHIKSLQEKGHQTIMIGDGLNDVIALNHADVGLVISDDITNFNPSCHGIIRPKALNYIDKLVLISQKSRNLIKVLIVISILYNILGLSFAITGHLEPIVAAIIMPLSSVTIVGLAIGISKILFSTVFAKKDILYKDSYTSDPTDDNTTSLNTKKQVSAVA